MYISEENVKLIRQFIEIKRRGHYVKSSTLQKVYNEVFNVNMSATSCGACLSKRVSKLEEALKQFEREQEARAKENNEIKEEEKEDAVEGEPSRTVKARKKTKPKAT